MTVLELNGQRIPVLEDLPDLDGKRVLVRATFDRPLSADRGQPLALRRAQGLAETLEWLHAKGAAGITVCGNLEASDAGDEAVRLDDELDRARQIVGAVSAAGAVADSVAFALAPERPDDVGRLVEHHDLFVNDTLQDSFLPLPSLTLPPSSLPSAAGRTLQRDLEVLENFMVEPCRPFVAVLGGERSFDRLHGLTGLVLRADIVLLGGALALPMLQALGRQPADGSTEAFLWECRNILGISRRVHHRITLPDDLVWRLPDGTVRVSEADAHGRGEVADIGPLTRIRFAEMVAQAGRTLWAGALGMVEQEGFATGTEALASSALGKAPVVYGGDALVTALAAARLLPEPAEMISATDAAVELLKDGDLPALAALRQS